MKLSTPRLLEIVAVAAILLLAAGLRLGWPGVNSFAFDEAHLSLIALEMARGGELARVGMPSSAGVPNLPAAAWIFSIPYLFSTDPLVATQFVGLLGMAAVGGVWWWARRTWGIGAGLVAALYLAASPFAVLYSRSIWAQNLLPVLALMWGWTALLGSIKQRRWAISAHVFLTGFIWQVHFAGVTLILPSIYYFARFRWWRNWGAVLLGGALASVILLPFITEIVCCRPDVLEQYAAALGSDTRYDLQSYVEMLRLGLALDWRFLLTGDLQPPVTPVLPIATGLLLAAGLGAIVITILRAANRAQETVAQTRHQSIVAEILLAWLLLPPLFFVRHSTSVFIHYQLVALPALALLAGASTQWMDWAMNVWFSTSAVTATPPPGLPQRIGGGGNRRLTEGVRSTINYPNRDPLKLKRVSHAQTGNHVMGGPFRAYIPLGINGVLMLLIASGWTGLLAQGLTLAGTVATPNGLGTPLKVTRQAARSVPTDAPVWFFTHGDDPNVDGEAAVFKALWWDREHQIVPGGSLLVLPDEPAYLMATLRYIQAWEELENANLVADEWTVPRREGTQSFVATDYAGEQAPAGFTLLDDPILLADGAQLLGWQVRWVGRRLRLSTLWKVVHTPSPGVYQQFHHLYATADSTAPLQIADVPIAAHHWRVGDHLIVMGDFFVDDVAESWVDIGHYTLPAVERIARTDGGDGVIRLGPLLIDPRQTDD